MVVASFRALRSNSSINWSHTFAATILDEMSSNGYRRCGARSCANEILKACRLVPASDLSLGCRTCSRQFLAQTASSLQRNDRVW
jgi:hypothetical protein